MPINRRDLIDLSRSEGIPCRAHVMALVVATAGNFDRRTTMSRLKMIPSMDLRTFVIMLHPDVTNEVVNARVAQAEALGKMGARFPGNSGLRKDILDHMLVEGVKMSPTIGNVALLLAWAMNLSRFADLPSFEGSDWPQFEKLVEPAPEEDAEA